MVWTVVVTVAMVAFDCTEKMKGNVSGLASVWG